MAARASKNDPARSDSNMDGSVKFRTVRSSVFAEDDEVPIERLPKRLEILKEYVIHPIDYGCRNFTEQIELWKNKELYKHFADTWEQFCRDNFSQPIEWINLVIEGTKILEGKGTVKEAYEAATLSSVGAKPGNRNAAKPEQAEYIMKRRSEGATQKEVAQELNIKQPAIARIEKRESITNKGDNITIECNTSQDSPTDRGTTGKPYTIARLKRDGFTELAEQVASGKKSARQARLEAGIEKPKITLSIPVDATPDQVAAKLLEKFDRDYIVELIDRLSLSKNLPQ